MGTGRKALRGGSWNNNWNNLRVANRNNNNPTNTNNNVGFRCASSPRTFLKGQVRCGGLPPSFKDAALRSERMLQVCSRLCLELRPTEEKSASFCVVGLATGSTLRAGRHCVNRCCLSRGAYPFLRLSVSGAQWIKKEEQDIRIISAVDDTYHLRVDSRRPFTIIPSRT
ncbi:MAG: SUMF1/EgtB/PvdO family nonheme iron enzyme [Anaerolineae bacterium]